MSRHINIFCDVAGCSDDASNWIEDDTKENKTFYLCSDHMTELCNEDEEIKILNTEDGTIYTKEVAVYSCNDKCDECNG